MALIISRTVSCYTNAANLGCLQVDKTERMYRSRHPSNNRIYHQCNDVDRTQNDYVLQITRARSLNVTSKSSMKYLCKAMQHGSRVYTLVTDRLDDL